MAPNEDIDVRSQLAVMNAQIQTLTKTVDALSLPKPRPQSRYYPCFRKW